MSDAPPGAGYWKASDGKWYPVRKDGEELEPGHPPGVGWWKASDGEWYPPDQVAAQTSNQRSLHRFDQWARLDPESNQFSFWLTRLAVGLFVPFGLLWIISDMFQVRTNKRQYEDGYTARRLDAQDDEWERPSGKWVSEDGESAWYPAAWQLGWRDAPTSNPRPIDALPGSPCLACGVTIPAGLAHSCTASQQALLNAHEIDDPRSGYRYCLRCNDEFVASVTECPECSAPTIALGVDAFSRRNPDPEPQRGRPSRGPWS